MRHFLLAAIYSACIAVFFASLLREDLKSALRMGITLFSVMLMSIFVLGWIMMLLAPA